MTLSDLGTLGPVLLANLHTRFHTYAHTVRSPAIDQIRQGTMCGERGEDVFVKAETY